MVRDFIADEARPLPLCWLYRCDDRSPFAYARGHDFIRNADHTLWAHLRDDQLMSVRSGEELAYRVGNVFYDAVSHEPVYYLPASLALPDVPGGQTRAVRATHETTPHRTGHVANA